MGQQYKERVRVLLGVILGAGMTNPVEKDGSIHGEDPRIDGAMINAKKDPKQSSVLGDDSAKMEHQNESFYF